MASLTQVNKQHLNLANTCARKLFSQSSTHGGVVDIELARNAGNEQLWNGQEGFGIELYCHRLGENILIDFYKELRPTLDQEHALNVIARCVERAAVIALSDAGFSVIDYELLQNHSHECAQHISGIVHSQEELQKDL